MSGTPPVTLFPPPPEHFKLYRTPNALAAPSHTLLSQSEAYWMFGRPIPNIKHKNNQKVVVPAIDEDVLLYNCQGDLSVEAGRLSLMLPSAVDELFSAIRTNPDGVNEQLRNFDNIVKSMFHLLEIAREPEAYEALVRLAQRAVEEKRKFLAELEEGIASSLALEHGLGSRMIDG